MVCGQVLIVFVGGAAFSVVRIPGKYWAVSLIIGLISLPIGIIIRLIPNGPCIVIGNTVMHYTRTLRSVISKPFRELGYLLHVRRRPVVIDATDEEHLMESRSNEKVSLVRDNLEVLSRLRGGRSRASSVVQRSRTEVDEFETRLKVSFTYDRP